jgi:hypothetical protein
MYQKNSLTSGTAVSVFLIPIVFSFVFGGAVLALSLQGQDRTFVDVGTTTLTSIEISGLQEQYSSSDAVSVQVLARDPVFSCGDLYITIYDVSSGQRKAVKQGAFFDQCYDSSGTLPVTESFSEKIGTPGQYLLEAQLFDEGGDKFLSASQGFSIQ